MEMEQAIMNTAIQLSSQCSVNLSAKVRCGDFVFVRDENQFQIAKIETVFDGLAHVVWYKRPNQLDPGVKLISESGLQIKFHNRELIEYGLENENVELDKICGVCQIIEAHENDSVAEILKRKKKEQMAYVCRYKLVKQTIYKLVPVKRCSEGEDTGTEMSDADLLTDNEDHHDVLNISAKIDELFIATVEKKEANIEALLVSPIKIVANKVEKITRTRSSHISPNKKRASPDAKEANNEVSPSKRNKLNDVSNFESPGAQRDKYVSPAQKKMISIKKNLSESFTDSEDPPKSPYSSKINSKEPTKLTILKKTLRERNDNITVSPMAIGTPSKRDDLRRSILKAPDSARNTPKRNVKIHSTPKTEDERTVESVTTPRRSTRPSMTAARDAIKSVAIEESSPSPEKRSRRSTIKNSSQPSTPKSASKRSIITKTPKTPKTPKDAGVMTPQQSRNLYRSGNLTPSIQSRQEAIAGEQTELEKIRERLQVSAVPTSLPCREKEFANIHDFITGKLTDGSGACIYISGVPGTGKTATVTQVIKNIQQEQKKKKLPAFDYVEINGMRLTEPRQAYVQIYRQLTGKTLAWAQARDLLEARFTAGSKKAIRPTILLVDELDIICNRKQDVVYNLFDWTVRKGSRLIAITIANTMDLPERVLKLKVASRLGLTRITFQPYTFKQLQQVVMTRLAGSICFMADAVQLVARKVASVSGDCRRALDICRRATEIAEEKSTDAADSVEVNFAHINQALTEMFASPKVRAIKNCTKFEKLFLQAVASEIQRTGIEEVEFHRVFWQMGTLAPVLGLKNPPTEDQAMMICMTLATNRLLIAEDSSIGIYQKIILNATVDDLYYALNVN